MTRALHVSSVPAERGFSLQNQIKMALQSHLEEERVTCSCELQAAKRTLDMFGFCKDTLDMLKLTAEDFAAMKKGKSKIYLVAYWLHLMPCRTCDRCYRVEMFCNSLHFSGKF